MEDISIEYDMDHTRKSVDIDLMGFVVNSIEAALIDLSTNSFMMVYHAELQSLLAVIGILSVQTQGACREKQEEDQADARLL